jgi:hypothetical protein
MGSLIVYIIFSCYNVAGPRSVSHPAKGLHHIAQVRHGEFFIAGRGLKKTGGLSARFEIFEFRAPGAVDGLDLDGELTRTQPLVNRDLLAVFGESADGDGYRQ